MEIALRFLGGIGLFLLGMSLMTDGLRDFAGGWLREQLVRFTGTPFRAFLSGAIATLMVQSSSATTVAVVGFVSAGLLTFPQALGVLFGASLGTTATGWFVATIGLKFRFGLYVLPLLVGGVFLRLLGRGRQVSLGDALSGFALIFVGLEYMQHAMENVASQIDVSRVAELGILSDLLAVLVGIVLTILMQSSSATVATALTALNAGTITLEHAAAIVIGAAIGTTVTGVLAALRSNVPARRTAMAHVFFNLATGLVALILLPFFLRLLSFMESFLQWDEPAISLAAFHSLFILVGVALFLPLIHRFANFIEWWVPDLGPGWTRHLDAAVRRVPAVAIEATRRALRETAIGIVDTLLTGLERREWPANNAEYLETLQEIQNYLEQLPVSSDDAKMIQERLAQMHAIDHLLRLRSRLTPPFTLQRALADSQQAAAIEQVRQVLGFAREGMTLGLSNEATTTMAGVVDSLKRLREEQRMSAIQSTALGTRTPAETLQLLDALRWMERVAAHASRTSAYLLVPVESHSVGSNEITPAT